ncbi:MAG: hypothetical protein ACLQIS_09775 [Bryobacteraceae bacterium]
MSLGKLELTPRGAVGPAVACPLRAAETTFRQPASDRNEPLLERARRIVAETAGIDELRAAEYPERPGGTVKVAILMARLGLGRREAETRLAGAGGRVCEVLNNG